MDKNIIKNHSGVNSGSISISFSQKVSILNCKIINNHSSLFGGALFV